MSLKPVYTKAPLMTAPALALYPGQVRMNHSRMAMLYRLGNQAEDVRLYAPLFQLATVLTEKPLQEPVVAKIQAALANQQEDGKLG